MPVPSLGFIVGPDVSKKEADLAFQKVKKWDRTHKLTAFSSGAERITKTLRQFPVSMWMFKPTREKWCVGEILWHLADHEANFYIRLRRALAEPGSAISSYDQNRWSQNLEYVLGNFQEALEILQLMRRSNVALLKRVPLSRWNQKVKHPEQGILTVDDLVSRNIWHLEHHLSQMANRYREWKLKKIKSPAGDRA